MTDNLYWLWLSLSCRAETGALLLQHFSHPHDIYKAKEKRLRHILGEKYPLELDVLLKKDLSRAHAVMDSCFLNGIGILPYDSPDYPPLLRQITAPPLVLYYRGHLFHFSRELCISVVGTREMTSYGEKAAFDISYDIASAGAVVVSGLALGIDGVAGAAALAAGGKTVAVLGSGVDRIYPLEHQTLYNKIVEAGMVISEYPPGTPPARFRFPERNRIISGISQATLLVEGPENSGAMITASRAMEQGRRVFAVPGNIDEPNSFSSNYLIRNGARAATSAEDILDAFTKTHAHQIHMERLLTHRAILYKNVLASYRVTARGESGSRQLRETAFTPSFREKPEDISPLAVASTPLGGHAEIKENDAALAQQTEEMEPVAKTVFLSLAKKPLNPDEIAERTTLPVAKVISVLLLLEIDGHVEQLAGNRYKITPKP